MLLRVALALALAAVVALVAVLHRRRRTRAAGAPHTVAAGTLPPVPAGLLGGTDRTWILFTTPLCASCGPVEAQLRAADPAAGLVRVDAARELGLAEDFRIRSAPTVLLADAAGRVDVRLVGAAAVDRYLSGRRPGAAGLRLS